MLCVKTYIGIHKVNPNVWFIVQTSCWFEQTIRSIEQVHH